MRFATSHVSLSFTPRLVPTLAALLVLLLTLYLATWQQGRAAEKRLLQAQFDARIAMPAITLAASTNVEPYRLAIAIGEYDIAGQLFLDNKSDGGIVGYHVVTPLRLKQSSRYVLVNRGFAPRSRDYPAPPVVDMPMGQIEVTGMLVSLTSKFIELGSKSPDAAHTSNAISGNVWQNLTIDRYRGETKRDVLPLVLLANTAAPPLRIVSERPDARVAKHVEYMLTWYSLAVTVVVLWLTLNTKFNREKKLP
jgi:surfeit locus 1 family protein